jgi:hypothetical protein
VPGLRHNAAVPAAPVPPAALRIRRSLARLPHLPAAAQRLMAGVAHRLPPGDRVDVVLCAAGPALSLPVELIRLTTDVGIE